MSDLWPCRPKAFPGESMFSWLGRVANANSLSFRKLKKILPFDRCKSAYEYDKVVTSDQLEYLSKHTGVSIGDLMKLTFYNAVGIIIPQVQGVRNRWIVRHKKQAVTPICIDCLNDNAPFYYRLHWRYAFITHCETHGTLLTDRCEACGSFLNIYSYLLSASEIDRHEMSCSQCGHLLYRFQGKNCMFKPALTKKYTDSMVNRVVDLKGKRLSSIAYFELVHLLASVLSGSRAKFNLLQAALVGFEDIVIDYKSCEQLESRTLDIEKRSIMERCQLAELIIKTIDVVDLTTLLRFLSGYHFTSSWNQNLPSYAHEIKMQMRR